MNKKIIEVATKKIQKSIDQLNNEFSRIHSGRASPALIDYIQINCYGNIMKLSQLSSISAIDKRTLNVTVWDKNLINEIKKKIAQMDLGLNPILTSDGCIKVILPPMMEETRKKIVKIVNSDAEKYKIIIRNIRRDVNGEAKELEKNKSISEDDLHSILNEMQEITNKYILEIEIILKRKIEDVLEI